LALRPVDNESFYREVDEELRRDQMKTYWERYGKLVIAGVVLLLALLAAYIWWQNQKEVKAGERSATLVQAFDDVAAGRKAAAVPRLDGLAKDGSDGHRAAALFKQIADDEGLARPYRDLALVRMTAVELDTLPPQAVIDRLKGLAVTGNAWHGSAGEMVALSYLKLNRPQQAAGIFAAMAKDKKLPDTLRSRATQMAGSLGVDAVQDSAGNTQEGTR
jgi:hypothetical protein